MRNNSRDWEDDLDGLTAISCLLLYQIFRSFTDQAFEWTACLPKVWPHQDLDPTVLVLSSRSETSTNEKTDNNESICGLIFAHYCYSVWE